MSAVAFPLDAVAGAPEYSGRMLRNALAGLLGAPPSGRPLGVTSGVRPGTPATTVSVAGSTCTISPHAGVLDVQTAAAAGPYFYAIGAAETKTVPAAHATYARWDRVSIQLSDPAEGDGTSTPGVAVVYTAGTPAASPALPAAPARSITLARVVVPQSGGGAASVVWMAPESAAGGVCWYTTEGDRNVALPTPPRDTIAVIGSGSTMQVTVWGGTAWQLLWSDTGWVTVTLAAGYTAVVPVQVRRIGAAVRWRGRISGAGLGSTGQKIVAPAANIPSWAHAASYQHTPCPVATIPTAASIQAQVSTANGLEVMVGTAGATDVWLAALRYDA